MEKHRYIVQPMSLDPRGGAVEANCNDISFFNFGTGGTTPTGAVLIIDDCIQVYPGQSYVITGNRGEENVSKHRFRFDTSGSSVINAIVTRKIYL